MSLVPRETDYDQRDYLLDGLRAFWEKCRYEHRLYWPEYSGITVYTFRWWKNKDAIAERRARAQREK